jgi:lysophospholipase L1-like esterase
MRQGIKKTPIHQTVYVLGYVFCIVVFGFLYVVASSALDSSWNSGAPIVQKISDSHEYMGPECRWEKRQAIVNNETSTRDLCIYYGKNIEIARGGSEGENYISIGGDKYFYQFSTNGNRALLINNTDTLVVRTNLNYAPVGVVVYHDLAEKLSFDPLNRSYTLDAGSSDFSLKDDSDNLIPVDNISFSENGEWMAGFSPRRGIIKTNLMTEEKRLIVSATAFSSSTISYLDISNDGQYIATISTHNNDRVYRSDAFCGVSQIETDITMQSECSFIPISDLPVSDTNTWSFYPAYIKFKNDDRQLDAVYWSSKTGKYTSYEISQPGYVPITLDYLALGDSYSSGEGDYEIGSDGRREQHYFDGTEKKGECHISDRSYPYLFAAWASIELSRMRSVACSGAQAIPDIFGNFSNYTGQGNRLLSRGGAIDVQKTNALKSFKPGIVPQLEFVKKYQPKVLTITMGGNDIGFGQIIQYCASPEMVGGVVPVAYTCGYALPGDLHDMLYATIDTQAQYSGRILQEIKKASLATKVYVVGYPKFINDTNPSTQCFNSPSLYLDIAERQEINRAISYMNRSLQNEAKKAGAYFVDTEENLERGRLCEGSEYVTGLMDVKYDIKNYGQESFHPNSLGHIQIANALLHSYRSPQTQTGSMPDDASRAVSNAAIYSFSPDTLVSGTSYIFSVLESMFQPGSTVDITAHSAPTKLFTATANQDGSLRADVAISQLPIGNHVITLSGRSFSGEPLTLYQFVTVAYSQTDTDGDGIPNDRDACQFITSLIDEKTGLDTCREKTGSSTTSLSSQDGVRLDPSQSKSIRPTNQERRAALHYSDTLESFSIKSPISPRDRREYDGRLIVVAIFVIFITAIGGVIYVIK